MCIGRLFGQSRRWQQAVTVACLVLPGCGIVHEFGDSYVRDSFYSDMKAINTLEATQREWLPNALPPSAREITMRQCCDTNEVWLRFRIDSPDADWFVGRLLPVSQSIVEPPRDPSRFADEERITWWPADLLAGEQLGEYTYYRDTRSGAFFAIDAAGGYGYYWRPAQ